jgi:hypothetical protein
MFDLVDKGNDFEGREKKEGALHRRTPSSSEK